MTWAEQEEIRNIEIYWPMSQKIVEIDGAKKFLSDRYVRNIMEIGSFKGGSTLLWAKMVKPYGGHVYSLDNTTFDRVYYGEPEEKHITEITCDTHDPATFEKVDRILNGMKIDFLFIDGDHTKEGVKQDFLMYSQFVKPQCWVGFHDIKDTWWHRLNNINIAPVWNDLKKAYPYFEFCDRFEHSCMGIGIIRYYGILEWEKMGWEDVGDSASKIRI